MNTTTTTAATVNALTLCTIADNEQFSFICSELANLLKSESETARTSAEAILDGTLKQAVLIAKAKTLTDKLEKERRPNVEKFSELIGYSYGMARKYLDLEKAYIKAEKEGRNVETFKELNRSVIANGKRPIYGIQAFTDYLEGKDIYAGSLAKLKEKEAQRAQKEAEKAEKEAEKEAEKAQKEAEKEASLRNSVLQISRVSMNNLIKDDIQVKIVSTETTKPIIFCSVNSSELEKAFNLILKGVKEYESKATNEMFGPIIETEEEITGKNEKALKNHAEKKAIEAAIREAMIG
jgi:hypothetical protein